MKNIVKYATADPHVQTINRLINDWAEKFSDIFDDLKILAVDGKYLSFKLFTTNHNDSIFMSFTETDEQEYFGEIQFSKGPNKEFMPIYTHETGINLHKDASNTEKK